MSGRCPTTGRLAAALRSREPAGADAELAAHLAECSACQARLESLAGGSSWVRATATTHTGEATNPSEPLQRAMQALESQLDPGVNETSPPLPELNFLGASDHPGAIGRFGSYEVIAHVASGGMGIVLKARDPALHRIVALKILSPALAASSLARARFVREARAAAAVVHDHVVPIYAVDECAGLPFQVMQFIHGRSLAERLRVSRALRLEEILRIGAQTASGLAAAHAQGLIHRDVKPGNILLENSVERVKLTDFGLARAADDAGLTRTGELAGTPEFMSPEQASNEAVDHRSDLFSFGIVLYAMCTGHSPFQATSVIAVVRKVCDARPRPVHEVNPAIPRWLSDIVAKLMAKSPNERFQSAREVSELLERYLARVEHGELGVVSEVPKRCSGAVRVRRVIIGCMAGLAIGLFFFALRDRHADPSHPRSLPLVMSAKTPFVVRDHSGAVLRELPDLEQAIKVAAPGAVIECRFSGDWPVEPIDVGDKALTIRAAANTKPVFVIARRPGPLLRTRAPLALEGLTFRIPAMKSRPSLSLYHSIFNEPVIESSNAPLFMANCRIELVELRGGPLGGGCCVGLLDNSFAAFQNCEFYAPVNGGIGHLHTTGASLDESSRPDRIIIRNSIQMGFYFLHLKDAQGFNAHVELTRNSTAGSCAVGFSERPQNMPVAVAATQNVFDVDHVVGTQPPAWLQPPKRLLRWMDATNLIHVKKGFTRTQPALATIDQWQNFVDGWKGGVPAELNLSRRIMELRSDINRFTPARFLLSEAETEQLEQIAPGFSRTLGVQPEICGPGEPYEQWKRSRAYADWQKQIHEAFTGPLSPDFPTSSSSVSNQEPFVVWTDSGTSIGAFTNIADALALVPSNGVVELRWNGAREMPPVMLPAKPLTLRGANGFQPLWIHTNLSVSALSASAALTVEDIELSLRLDAAAAPGRLRPRPRMTRSGAGLLAISNAPLRLSRCVLRLPDPRLQPQGGPLGIVAPTVIVLENVAACEVENSALLGAPWTVISWRSTAEQATVADGQGREARLSLSNCVVTGFRILSPELPESSRLRLEMIRSTFEARHVIDFYAASAGRGLTVVALTNIFAMGSIVLDGRGSSRDALTTSMRWQGRGNLFSMGFGGPRSGAYIVMADSSRESWPDTLSEWNQWWPESEAGSREVSVTFAGGGMVPDWPTSAAFVRAAYKVEHIVFKEGVPLTPDQWPHFGADVANIGPRSAK